MRLSKEDIKNINKRRSARKGQIYYSFDGSQYLGQADGSLLPYGKSIPQKQEDRALETRLGGIEGDITDIQTDVAEVRAEIKKTECKLIAMNIILGC